MRAIFPSGPITNVARWTPQYVRPYIDFSTQVPYFSAILWSASASSVNGRSYLSANLRSFAGSSGEMPSTTAPASS